MWQRQAVANNEDIMVTGQRKSKKSESLQGMESKKNRELCSSRHKTTFLIYDEQAWYSATSLMKSRTCVQKGKKEIWEVFRKNIFATLREIFRLLRKVWKKHFKAKKIPKWIYDLCDSAETMLKGLIWHNLKIGRMFDICCRRRIAAVNIWNWIKNFSSDIKMYKIWNGYL